MNIPSGYFAAWQTMNTENATSTLVGISMRPSDATRASHPEARLIVTHAAAPAAAKPAAMAIGDCDPGSPRARARAKIGHRATPAADTTCQTGRYIWAARL